VHDVVIVGGGLAGAALATHLARSGHDVVVLERKRAAARKACGEGLFGRGIEELRALGVLESLSDESQPLAGVRFHAGGQSAAAHAPAMGVRRGALEGAVLNAARTAGASVCEGATVRRLSVRGGRVAGVVVGDHLIEAKVVVGADGLNSIIRRRAGLEAQRRGRRFGVTAHIRPPREPAPWVDVYFEHGYEMYLTPVGGGVVNAAILTRRAGMSRFTGNLGPAFAELLRSHHATAGAEIVDAPLAAGPFAASCRRAYRSNLVLAGDAAGFFDGITGEGMSAALAGARLCATAIEAHLGGDARAFARYDHEQHSLVRNSNVLGQISLALGSQTRLATVAVRNLARRPETFERLVAINSGAKPLRSLRPRDFGALLLGR
jgi:flavin-dependent dehydrogenase